MVHETPRNLARPLLALPLAAALAGCSPSSEAGADLGAPDAAAPTAYTVGADLDEHTKRELKSSYTLPAAFYAALKDLAVAPADLDYPDINLTFARDLTRLGWTDSIRHQGDQAPVFGYLVIDEVEALVGKAGDPPDTQARDLLAAQSTYNDRDELARSRYDRAVTVSDGLVEGRPPLLEALRAFHARAKVAGGPREAPQSWESIEPGLIGPVALVPLPTQVAIAQAIQGLLLAATLRDEALTGGGQMDMAKWATSIEGYLWDKSTPLGLAAGRTMSRALDFERMARAGQLSLRSLESLRVALKGSAPVPGARLEVDGALGRITIALDAADDTWTGAGHFLLVDGAGDDAYLDDVGANKDLFQPIAAVLDLAGNDRWGPSVDWDISEKYLPGPFDAGGGQGAGLFGVAVVVDAAGDDRYQCTSQCQGYGLFGVGALVDRGGKDSYRGYDLAQGAAEYGYGLLLDTGGAADRYETLRKSEGYGGTRGVGWLVDDAGDDEYLAIEDPIIENWANEDTNWTGGLGFGFGTRILPSGPYLSGGLGGLFDLDGNDTYQCAVMCLGFGYFFGTGLFYDRRGDDAYVVSHKYGIGGATHQSAAIFVDGQGKDSYTYTGHGKTAGGEGVGLGYDDGVAFHLDRGAEADTYTFVTDAGYVLGQSRHPGLGVLINEGGDDTYTVPAGAVERSLGRAETFDYNRAGGLMTPSVALFLDLGGKGDRYPARAGTGNGARWTQTLAGGSGWNPALDHGYGVDSE